MPTEWFQRTIKALIRMMHWLDGSLNRPPQIIKRIDPNLQFWHADKLWEAKTNPVIHSFLTERGRDTEAGAKANRDSLKACPEFWNFLIGGLEHEDDATRFFCLSILAATDYPGIVDSLTAMLKEEHPLFRSRILGELGRLRAALPICRLLKDPVPSLRSQAARILGEIGDHRVVPHLYEAAQDPEWLVRDATMRALNRLGSPEAIPIFIRGLDDDHEVIRAIAAHGIAQHAGDLSLTQQHQALTRLQALCPQWWSIAPPEQAAPYRAAILAIRSLRKKEGLPVPVVDFQTSEETLPRAAEPPHHFPAPLPIPEREEPTPP